MVVFQNLSILSICLASGCQKLFVFLSSAWPCQQPEENAYTVSYRPPELCTKSIDLTVSLTTLCDAWAAGLSIIETGSSMFFKAETQVKILDEIMAFAGEAKVQVRGPQTKRLKAAISKLHPDIRDPVSLLVRPSVQTRGTVTQCLSKRKPGVLL